MGGARSVDQFGHNRYKYQSHAPQSIRPDLISATQSAAERPPRPPGTGIGVSVTSGLPLVELRDATIVANGRSLFPRTTWAIRPGEHWAIVGPNGAGKSTLAKALWDGVLIVDGEVSYPAAEAESRDSRLPKDFSPAAYVRHVCFEDQRERVARHSRYLQGRYESLEGDEAPTAGEVLGVPRSGEPRADGGLPGVSELVDRLGLRGSLDRHIPHLSNGEMRKLLIVEALLKAPRLLILEEPLQGLDGRSRRELARLLARVASLGVTLVIVTARPGDVTAPVRRVLWVRDGMIAGRGLRGESSPTGMPASARHPDLRPPKAGIRCTKSDVVVQLREVTVRAGGRNIIDGVSWTIREGENWALVGPNGSGKTTLLSLILADNPQAYVNDVRVFGQPRGAGESIWDLKARLGHVSPEAQIHYSPGVTVREAICSGFFDSIGLFELCSDEQAAAAAAWAQALDLGGLIDRPFGSLSDGQKRLVLLARALVKTPRLLVLDEPCQGLDDAHRRKVLQIVDGLGRELALSIIYVTHEPREIPRCITHVLRLERGRVKSRSKSLWCEPWRLLRNLGQKPAS
jgi:molybdate transport system ATP-binding protein